MNNRKPYTPTPQQVGKRAAAEAALLAAQEAVEAVEIEIAAEAKALGSEEARSKAYFTVWGYPKEKIQTNRGAITYREYLERERDRVMSIRGCSLAIVSRANGEICLKYTEAQQTDQKETQGSKI